MTPATSTARCSKSTEVSSAANALSFRLWRNSPCIPRTDAAPRRPDVRDDLGRDRRTVHRRVLGLRARTFCVEGHHYALVIVEGLAPGSSTPYEVRLDGERRWPLGRQSRSRRASIRTLGDAGRVRVLFGSCRTAAPHEPPWSLELAARPDAAAASTRCAPTRCACSVSRPSEWPHLARVARRPGLRRRLVARDARADRGPTRARTRRGPSAPSSSADFEEYCWLYHESWSPEVERWFFSVVPRR